MSITDAFLAARAGLIEASGIRKFFDLAASMPDACNLSIGQADFDVPAPIKDAAVAAIHEGFNRYTVTQGIPELRDAVRQHLVAADRGITDDDEILITSGVSGGLLLAFFNLLDPGDGIALPDPYFVMYRHLAAIAGLTPSYYDTYPDFQATAERVAPALGAGTKVLLVNSPQNPTGATYAPGALEEIAGLARERGAMVIADEIYDEFVYDAPHASLKKHYPEGTLLLGGMSKTYGMPGWRLGYACGPKWLIDRMAILQQFSYVCAPAPFQKACVTALHTDMAAEIAHYRKKRDFVYDGLKDDYPTVKPGGSFYFFPEVPERLRATFIERCIERQLLVVPGGACSHRNTHFRLSFAASDAELERGVEILREIARS